MCVCVFTFLSLFDLHLNPIIAIITRKKKKKKIRYLIFDGPPLFPLTTANEKTKTKHNYKKLFCCFVVALMRFRFHLNPSLPIPANNNNPFINIFIQLILLLRVKVTEECPPPPFKMAAIDFPIFFFFHSIEEMKMGRREFDKHQTTPTISSLSYIRRYFKKQQQCYTYNKFVFPLLFLCCTSPLILC